MIPQDAELAWVRRAQAGSSEAFAKLVGVHQSALRAFLRRLCGNWSEADDIAQETFLIVWQRIARFDGERSFRAWLFGIAWRKYREQRRSWLRRLMRERHAAEMTETITTPDPGLRLDLTAATAALAPEQRAALLLCLAADFTHAEAAEALSLPLGTIKSHIARARETLAAALGASHGCA